jgi:prepilin-type N-terminal cleavage/methylation domain-containing protein
LANRTPPCRPGFTLTETLIASAILAVVALALTAPFALAARHQRADSIRTTCAALASARIERMMTMTCAQVLAADGTVESGIDITGFDGQPLDDPTLEDYSIVIQVSQVAIPVGSETPQEAAKFALATVTASHPEAPPLKLSRMFSE